MTTQRSATVARLFKGGARSGDVVRAGRLFRRGTALPCPSSVLWAGHGGAVPLRLLLAALLGLAVAAFAQQPSPAPPAPPQQNPVNPPPPRPRPPRPRPRPPIATIADLLITGGTVVTMNPAQPILNDGALMVRGSVILEVGPREKLEGQYPDARRIDARGHIVLPGFINTHTHAPMALLRGLANDMTLEDWLAKAIFPAEARNVTEDFSTWGTRLAALEMIEGGTTTFVDMYYFEDAVAREAKAAGLRGVLGETVIDVPVPDSRSVGQSLAQIEEYLQRWQGDPLIRPAVAPHSPYTCSADTLRRAAALARRYHAPLLIHVAETKHEREESLAAKQLSPVAWLESIGFLGPDVLAAHCVWVDEADRKALAARGAGCAYNPSSNMMLASGVAPVPLLLAAGVRLGLGTDGPAGSNNDLDMMLEMNVGAKLQKVSQLDPRALSAAQVLEMATLGGARALHMEDQIGSLEAGKQADIILLRAGVSHGLPIYDLPAEIVYALKASDVDTVIVAGRVLMHDRRVLTLDKPSILAKAKEYGEKVRQSLAPATKP